MHNAINPKPAIMSIRTFWSILIKILGIWLLLDCLTVIPQFFIPLFYTRLGASTEMIVFSVLPLVLTIVVYVFIMWLLVFRTALLIDKLHLTEGFSEEKIELNIPHSAILAIATIVIGGLLFADSLPHLCKQLFVFFQQKNMFRNNPDSGYIVLYFAKTIVGYLLMTNSSFIVRFVNGQIKEQ